MFPVAAFLLGLLGSLHCLGMCGPLVMALSARRPDASFLLGRSVYHAGRLTTYVGLGLVFGAIGGLFSLAGWQRWISIAAGAAILLGLVGSSRLRLGQPAFRLVGRLRPRFATLWNRGSLPAHFTLGLLNGLLPCGLVYVAAAAATASGSLASGAVFMAAFGLGTVPALFGAGWIGTRLARTKVRFRYHKLVPAGLCLVAALLILRGMALGIPYLSPGDPVAGASCHAPAGDGAPLP